MRVTPGLGLLNRSVVDQDRLDSVEVVLDRLYHEIGYPLLVPQSATCEIENHLVSSETTMNPIATKRASTNIAAVGMKQAKLPPRIKPLIAANHSITDG